MNTTTILLFILGGLVFVAVLSITLALILGVATRLVTKQRVPFRKAHLAIVNILAIGLIWAIVAAFIQGFIQALLPEAHAARIAATIGTSVIGLWILASIIKSSFQTTFRSACFIGIIYTLGSAIAVALPMGLLAYPVFRDVQEKARAKHNSTDRLLPSVRATLKIGETKTFKRPNGQKFTLVVNRTPDTQRGEKGQWDLENIITNNSDTPLTISIEEIGYATVDDSFGYAIGVRDFNALDNSDGLGPTGKEIVKNGTGYIMIHQKQSVTLNPGERLTSPFYWAKTDVDSNSRKAIEDNTLNHIKGIDVISE